MGSKSCAKPGFFPGRFATTKAANSFAATCTSSPCHALPPSLRGATPRRRLWIPIAHGEGNYFIGDDGLKGLQDNDQILFQYCDENGAVNAMSNPNGALLNIAGVCNEGKNVFGMMPHPERACSDDLANADGRAILPRVGRAGARLSQEHITFLAPWDVEPEGIWRLLESQETSRG